MIRKLSLLLSALLLAAAPAGAASIINTLPAVTFPLPDPGNPTTATENLWIANGTGPNADFRITPTQAGYIFQGTVAPTSPFHYQLWWNTGASPPQLEVYDGTQWNAVGTLDASAHAWSGAIPGSYAAPVYQNQGFIANNASNVLRTDMNNMIGASQFSLYTGDQSQLIEVTVGTPQQGDVISGSASVLGAGANPYTWNYTVLNGDTASTAATGWCKAMLNNAPFIAVLNRVLPGAGGLRWRCDRCRLRGADRRLWCFCV